KETPDFRSGHDHDRYPADRILKFKENFITKGRKNLFISFLTEERKRAFNTRNINNVQRGKEHA
ncbi:MAG TPA: hypothetical protein VIF12_08790, partial [Micavibrio sp.]